MAAKSLAVFLAISSIVSGRHCQFLAYFYFKTFLFWKIIYSAYIINYSLVCSIIYNFYYIWVRFLVISFNVYQVHCQFLTHFCFKEYIYLFLKKKQWVIMYYLVLYMNFLPFWLRYESEFLDGAICWNWPFLWIF